MILQTVRDAFPFMLVLYLTFFGHPFRLPGENWLREKFKENLRAIDVDSGEFAETFVAYAKRSEKLDGAVLRVFITAAGFFAQIPTDIPAGDFFIWSAMLSAVTLVTLTGLTKLDPDSEVRLNRSHRFRLPVAELIVLITATMGLLSAIFGLDRLPSLL